MTTNSFRKIFNIKKEYILLIFILGFSLILRLLYLDSAPLGLNQDEAVNGVDAYFLLNTGLDHHKNLPGPFLQSFNDWVSPVLTYTTIPFVYLFGLSIFTIRLVTVLYGVGTLLFLYILFKILNFRPSVSLLMVSFASLSPFLFHMSRWAIPPSTVPFYLSLVLVFQVLILKNPNKHIIFKVLGLVFSSAILTYSYPTMKLFAPLFLLIFLGVWFLQSLSQGKITSVMNFFKHIFYKLSVFLSFLILVSPIYYYTLLDPAKYNARFATETIQVTGENVIIGFLVRYFGYFSPHFLFLSQSDPNTMQRPDNFGLLNLWGILLYFISVYFIVIIIYNFIKFCFQSIKQSGFSNGLKNLTLKLGLKKESFYIKLLLVFGLLLAPVAASLTKDYFMSLRTIHLFTFLIIFFAYSLNYIFNKIPSQIKNFSFVSFILIIFSFVPFLYYYLNEYSYNKAGAFNYGNLEVVRYFDKNQDKYTSGKIDTFSLYYYFEIQPQNPEVVNSQVLNKKYSFEGVNLNDYQIKEIVYEVKTPNKNQVIWRVYETENNIWLAKKL
jgi:hypothetical protein